MAMRTLFASLFAPAPEPLDIAEGEIALAALLVRLARVDDHYGEAEQIRIEHLFMSRQGLLHEEARKLRREAEELEDKAPDTVRFTRALKASIPYEDRIGVVKALWEIALSDGERAPEEEALIRLCLPLLGVSDLDSAMARRAVLRDLGIAP